MNFLLAYFDVAPNLLLAIILVVLFRRRFARKYPLFLAYILFDLVYFAVALAAYLYMLRDPVRLTRDYQWVVTLGLPVGAIFEFGALYEVADQQLLSRIITRERLRSGFRWAVALLLLLAAVLSALLWQPSLTRVVTVFQALNFSANLTKIGLLLALILLTRTLGISWRSLPAGIALGFGISATAEIAGSALLSLLQRHAYIGIDLIRMVAFHVCVLIWLIYLLLPERPRPLTAPGVQVSELELHLHELQKIVKK